MKRLLFLILLSSCSNFAPQFDSNVNAKMAEIKTNALDMRESCPLVSYSKVHDRLELSSITLQFMTVFRDANTYNSSVQLTKEIKGLEVLAGPKMSFKYCEDKLNDIVLSIDTIMKPYGGL